VSGISDLDQDGRHSRHRKQIWKGPLQRPFNQRLVEIDPVVSEEKIFMCISHSALC
jgi:hypothetical protein